MDSMLIIHPIIVYLTIKLNFVLLIPKTDSKLLIRSHMDDGYIYPHYEFDHLSVVGI